MLRPLQVRSSTSQEDLTIPMAYSPRKKEGWRLGLGTVACLAASLLIIVLCLAGGGFLTGPPAAGGGPAGTRVLGLPFFGKPKPFRSPKVGDTFGTIFHLELKMFYAAQEAKPEYEKLIETLRNMKANGIKTVVFSESWDWAEPEQGKIRFAYLDGLMTCACKNAEIKVDFIFDLLQPPKWIYQRYPDARAHDADNRTYAWMSWFHQLSNKEARRFLGASATYLQQNYPGCIQAIQPVYNNEYEAKYTQEYDAYQDYSPYAIHAFREWLRSKGAALPQLSQRWQVPMKTWDDVMPPKLHGGDYYGADITARYWDWIKFREEHGAAHFNAACATVHEAGLQCFHHFPEFFSVIDAIYGAPMFKHIVASPVTDFVIMDSNFRTPYGTLMNPNKLRLYVGAAVPYGKPVYFEAAVERFADLKLLEAGFRATLLAGAPNLGITNWHTRVEVNESLARIMGDEVAPKCATTEVVGVFLHLDSCAVFHGLQFGWVRKDPLHDFVEDLADRLAQDCGTDVGVYIELDRFLADLPRFNRVVFIEPLILYGNKELESYIAAKAVLKSIPHEILHLPANITAGGSQLVVLQDLGKTPSANLPVHHAASPSTAQ
ncbi:hypothetical protein Agub_g4115 [Astrephomene gubernaculifera]|uniref:Glycoside hydrolase family 42 N-terminal domain-containing protein n=1 Tax=Astrephomene gubernaculifera TaxID=47775 RepID=A0AAD3HJ02_9CHLO|nr:hypothetical protein Agub_g4115 [Astrephomene gubernaculifera]